MRHLAFLAIFLLATAATAAKPWDRGPLRVSDNHRFLQHADGTPFFLQGETAWLMPQRLSRDEVQHYLQCCHDAGYNMVQMQVLNDVPSWNVYGQSSDDEVYWQHVDYIVDQAACRDIYVGMVCIWGGLVKAGKLSTGQARDYGTRLARRYGPRPNIIWIIGGDIQGDVRPDVWQALATAIKGADPNHLMTFHPRGRHTSAQWWAGADWIDFHCFQSGHRRYGQRMGDKTYPIPDGTEEDNFQYVDSTWARQPLKPVIDDEPAYEGIPQGLHGKDEPLWTAADVRRYAYWSVFAGACGHTYGNSAIMQFYKPGYPPAYHNRRPWYEALGNPGFSQMQYLRRLILAFPYFERVPDQSLVVDNGLRYDRLAATRGTDYLLVYNCTGRPMRLDLTRIAGQRKRVWWMNATDGSLKYLGEYDSAVLTFRPHGVADGVLIACDAAKSYLNSGQPHI